MLGNGPAWFGGGPHGKGVPSRKPPRRAAYPVNAHGLSALDPHWGPGAAAADHRPTDEAYIVADRQQTRPKKLGLPFTHWSLRVRREVALL